MCFAASTASTNPTARRKLIAAKPAGCFTIAATARSRTSRPTAASSTAARSRSAWPCWITISDGWPDLFVANDTQPNKLYRNQRNGTFKDIAVEAGLLSATTARRAPAWAWTWPISIIPAIPAGGHELRQRDDRPLPRVAQRPLRRRGSARPAWAWPSRSSLGFGCFFFDADLDGCWICWWSTATSTRRCAIFAATWDTLSRRNCS